MTNKTTAAKFTATNPEDGTTVTRKTVRRPAVVRFLEVPADWTCYSTNGWLVSWHADEASAHSSYQHPSWKTLRHVFAEAVAD